MPDDAQVGAAPPLPDSIGLAERPPLASVGIVGWVRQNLFNGIWNSILTVLALALIVWALPPIASQYLNLVKNSSLAVAIGYPDLVSIANTTINQTGQAIEGIAIIMAVYLTVSLSISAFMNWYNARVLRQ